MLLKWEVYNKYTVFPFIVSWCWVIGIPLLPSFSHQFLLAVLVIFLSSVYWPTLPVLFPFFSIQFLITKFSLFWCCYADWVQNLYKFWVKTRFTWFSYSTWKGFRTKLDKHISCHTSQTYTQALRENSGSLFQHIVLSNAHTAVFCMVLLNVNFQFCT